MVAQSRFRDFYEKWKNEEKIELLNEMARLIEENSAYADRNNYAHMCNLITSLAMVIVLEKSGKTREEAEKRSCRRHVLVHTAADCFNAEARGQFMVCQNA